MLTYLITVHEHNGQMDGQTNRITMEVPRFALRCIAWPKWVTWPWLHEHL